MVNLMHKLCKAREKLSGAIVPAGSFTECKSCKYLFYHGGYELTHTGNIAERAIPVCAVNLAEKNYNNVTATEEKAKRAAEVAKLARNERYRKGRRC